MSLAETPFRSPLLNVLLARLGIIPPCSLTKKRCRRDDKSLQTCWAAWFCQTIAVFLLGLGSVAALDVDRLRASIQRFGGEVNDLRDWQRLLDETRTIRSTEEKLRRINDFFNQRIQFAEDMQIWGQSDYWATPMETLAKGRADCEDFTIAKYFSLLEAGIPNDQLRLVYVKARIGGAASSLQQAHMVLAWYASPDAEPLVLDNLISDIRSASRRPDLAPVFSFNSKGIWQGAAGNASQSTGGLGRLSRWQDLLQRARQEGFD